MEEVFSYALRKFLDEYFTEISRAVIIEDGVNLSEVSKPFVTIEYLGSNDEIIAAGRYAYEETHRYQLGLFVDSAHQRAKLANTMKELLRLPQGIPLYNMATRLPTGQHVVLDVTEFTTMSSSDATNETYQNHGYFIVAIEILRDAGESSFTQ